MSLSTNIGDLATRIATECKSIRTLVNGNAGDLTSLTTTAKSNLVAAINELNAAISAASGIDDGSTSTSSTWSSSKISDELTTLLNEVLNGAPGALDTLDELAAAIGDDANFAATVTTALGNRVRFDAAQTLTAPQKTQALDNIGAAASGHTHSDATTSVAGFMSAADKTKLDGVAANANNYTHPSGDGNLHVPATGTTSNGKVLKAAGTAGSASWQTLAKSDVGLSNVDDTSDANKPISTATQTALDGKANTTHDHADATTSADGFMSAADKTKLDGIAANANNYSHPSGDGNLHVPATSTTNNGKVLKAGATAGSLSWGTLAKGDVGLGNVDNTSDANKPVSTATQTALDGKLDNSHAGSGGSAHANAVASGAAGFMTGADKAKLDGVAANANNYVHPTTDGNRHVPATAAGDVNKFLKAAGIAGNASAWASLAKADVGLSNVDNTSDANKPVSTAQQTALDLKANSADVGSTTADFVATFNAGLV